MQNAQASLLLLASLYVARGKCADLPRQARDNHRKDTHKKTRFRRLHVQPPVPIDVRDVDRHGIQPTAHEVRKKKTSLLSRF